MRTDTIADCGSADEVSEDVEETKSPRSSHARGCRPRVSWHICDDADGRTPVVDSRREICVDISGFMVVTYYRYMYVKYRAEVSKHVQTGFGVCRVACRKI